MAETFRCTLVTPEAQVLDEDVTYVTFPAWDGQVGIAPGRSPLLARVGIGSMRLDFPGGASRWYMLEGGFAQMLGDRLTILSDKSTPAETLIASDAARELEAALTIQARDEASAKAREAALQAAREKRRMAKVASERGI